MCRNLYYNRNRCEWLHKVKNSYSYSTFSLIAKWLFCRNYMLWFMQRQRMCCTNGRHKPLFLFLVNGANHFMPDGALSYISINLHCNRQQGMRYCLHYFYYRTSSAYRNCYKYKRIVQRNLRWDCNCHCFGRNTRLYLFVGSGRMQHFFLHRIVCGKLYAHSYGCEWLY